MKTLEERLAVESGMRFRIDERLREAGIAIAFPQRDVHLAASKPIERKLLEGSGIPEAKDHDG